MEKELNILEKIGILLEDHQTGMTKFQDDNFVTAKAGITVYGQYKQSLREVYKRVRGLREGYSDRDKLLIEIDEQKWIMENDEDQFKRRYAEVEYNRKTMQMDESRRVLEDTQRELENFYNQAENFKSILGELTPEREEILEMDMWNAKFQEMAAIDIVTTGSIGAGTYELMNSFPSEMKAIAFQKLTDPNQLVLEYQNKESIALPESVVRLEIGQGDFNDDNFLK